MTYFEIQLRDILQKWNYPFDVIKYSETFIYVRLSKCVAYMDSFFLGEIQEKLKSGFMIVLENDSLVLGVELPEHLKRWD